MAQHTKVVEHAIHLDDPSRHEAVVEAVRQAGGKLLHRFGPNTLVVTLDKAEAEIARLLPAGARLIAIKDPPPASLSRNESLLLQAQRLRNSPAYQQARTNRKQERVEWGTGGLPEPDAPDDERPAKKFGPEE